MPQGNDPALVIAVDTSEDALKLALHCGADHAVTADGHQAEHVRDLTSTGADAVFDFVGEDSTITDSVAMLRPGGTYYLVGYGGTVTLPTLQLILVTLASQGKVTLHSASYPLDAARTPSTTFATAGSAAGPSSFPAEPAGLPGTTGGVRQAQTPSR